LLTFFSLDKLNNLDSAMAAELRSFGFHLPLEVTKSEIPQERTL
jgi:hypothetical protein